MVGALHAPGQGVAALGLHVQAAAEPPAAAAGVPDGRVGQQLDVPHQRADVGVRNRRPLHILRELVEVGVGHVAPVEAVHGVKNHLKQPQGKPRLSSFQLCVQLPLARDARKHCAHHRSRKPLVFEAGVILLPWGPVPALGRSSPGQQAPAGGHEAGPGAVPAAWPAAAGLRAATQRRQTHRASASLLRPGRTLLAGDPGACRGHRGLPREQPLQGVCLQLRGGPPGRRGA
mmetsp:Transcript_58154/g.186844  ORF Transcript_58154/g.186844 Transcript_58154/m.186844 type:complete len:231 (-) Transcript_58154:816-1508(-)